MRSSPQASPDDIDITSVWGTLKRSLPRILLASFLAGGLTYGALSLVAPRYASEAQLAILAKDPSGAAVEARMDKEAVNTHVRALLSADLAQKVIAELKLDKKPEFNAAAGPADMASRLLRMAGIGAPNPRESDLDRALAAYFRNVEVYSPKESRSIVIRVTSIEPELAKTIANLIAETYRATLSAQSAGESTEVRNDLEPKIASLKEEVTAADAEVERFRAEADIIKATAEGPTMNEQQLSELTAELTRAKAARSEVESRANSAREMMKSGSADALPDVQKSPLIQELIQQRVRLEREIAEASAALLPGHPRMRQLSSELAGLKKQIQGEVAKVVESLEKEAKVAALRESSIEKSLSEIKSRVVTVAPDKVKLAGLEATAKAKRAELETLEAQYETARAKASSKAMPVEAKVMTQARASSIPVYPKKTPFAALAACSIFLLGAAFSITRALLTGARRGPAYSRPSAPEASRSSEPEFAAPIAARPRPATASAAPPSVEFEDRIQRVTSVSRAVDHLENHAPPSGGCRVLVVGENNAIDASAEAVELTKTLSARGHAAILIDWSPDGSGFAIKRGLAKAPGVNELLAGSVKFEDVIHQLPQSEAHIIASGSAQPYSSEGTDPDQLNLVLDALDEAYSYIIVSGPHDAARLLFETIEGRFDAGITVSDGKKRVSVIQDPPGTFLGYEVADIELLKLERRDGAPAAPQRIVRRTEAEART